mgnify:CR=1 FL=1
MDLTPFKRTLDYIPDTFMDEAISISDFFLIDKQTVFFWFRYQNYLVPSDNWNVVKLQSES